MISIEKGRHIIVAAKLIVASAAWLLPSAVAFAYSPEQEQACTGDAMRLCGAYIPDVDRITACMISNKAQLSPVCRAHFGPPPAAARPIRVRTKPIALHAKPARKPVRRHGAK